MKRKLILITVIMSMSMSSLVFANDKPAPTHSDIKVNGTDIGVDYIRQSQNSEEQDYYEVMVPLKPVAESLGYEVYNATYGDFAEPSYKSVILIKDDTAISVKEGSTDYIVNHQVISLEEFSPATVIDGEMYVTAEFFYSVLGYEYMTLDQGELVINTIPEANQPTEQVTSNEAPSTNTEKPENVNSNGIDIDGVSTEKTYTKTENGDILVPLKIVSEELGYSVVENENGTIDISSETMKISCKIGSKEYNVNGVTKTLNTAPSKIEEVVYLPIEFMTDILGYQYDSYSTGINIVTKAPSTERPDVPNGTRIDINAKPTEANYIKTETGEILIPLKIVFEEIGYSVVENENGTIDISNETMKISCKIGSKDYTLNGEVVTLDTAPIDIDGEVYAPIEILHLFGYGYDSYSTGINIVTATPEEMMATNEDIAKLNKLGYYYLDGDKIVKFQLY